MDVGQCQSFLSMLGCDRITVGAQWVRSTCPMGYRHSGGADKTPSFAISIDPGDKSNGRCQGCDFGGDLMTLLWRLEVDRRRVHSEAVGYLRRFNQIDTSKLVDEPPPPNNDSGIRKTAYRPGSQRVSRFVRPEEEPQARVREETLREMIGAMPPHILDYLTREPDPHKPDHLRRGRRLDPQTVITWELGWQERQRRVCIPIRDTEGNLVAVTGRAFSAQQSPKYLHSSFKRDRVLYGEHRVDRSKRYGYLFEGFFQVMYADQNGYPNPVARMGSHLSRQQAGKLVSWFDHLIIVPDGDIVGKDSAERIAQDLGSVIRVDVSDMPRGRDADTLKPAKLFDVLGPPITA